MRRRYCRFLLPYWFGCFYDAAHSRARPSACFSNELFEESFRLLQTILHFLHSLYTTDGLRQLIHSGGAPLVCIIVFIETGFFVGFFLPGDSLLITAGIFSSNGDIPLKWLLLPVM